MTERIHKALARAGLGSRREIEAWIMEGRVIVNERPAVLGQQLTSNCRVVVDGERVRLARQSAATGQVLLYHKPVGEICSRSDPQGRPNVFDSLPRLRGKRWVSVGRLDINTSGLMIFTTDGELANRLMHPSSEMEREYRCRVRGNVSSEALSQLLKGVKLDGHLCRFESVTGKPGTGANCWFRVVIKEGRYREVRRMWQSIGCSVNRLIRLRYGPFSLDHRHQPGESVELGEDLKKLLIRSIGRKPTLQAEKKVRQPNRLRASSKGRARIPKNRRHKSRA
ncbi:pseudouridine synthase [Arenicellales bacterium nBUS_45]